MPDMCSSLCSPLQIGGGQTINANVLHVAVGVIKESRQLRLQPFNEYRKRFGMKPYKSFQELTGRAAMLLLGFAGAGQVLCPSLPCLLVAPQWDRLG